MCAHAVCISVCVCVCVIDREGSSVYASKVVKVVH